MRTVGAIAGLIVIPALSAWADSVHVDSTPGFSFAGKAYTWRVHPVFEKRPELAEKYSVGIELVKNAVNQNLMDRGYQPAAQSPNFYITFLLTGEMKQDVDVVYESGTYSWGGWYGWSSMYYPMWSRTVVSNYVEGVLVLDIVDAESNQLVWRAYCRGDVRDWKNRHKDVRKAVDKALKRFPPKK